mmetsp:Transcript_39958/g.80608  ORF Transcript_39958/g.80608 Transcript_39958/m.80608 type:complete len:245 (-) Transcript_39958:97-831(-)|eukprot:CAMPEP_0171615780 /NCGR_PEP_ID=MMETSP0990-20121206/13086_1 /TAXON_ID=483369 /ORGANISM="non described non described, Strain CCMP2098" /LENGTH=244 /DNA_ID=CAMNT_0012179921 /DNA_START=221 /DNA_END=955 /DNA_ORIENTATION=-
MGQPKISKMQGNQPSVSSRPLVLGKQFPDVKGVCNKTATTPEGTIDFGEYTADSWAILFSHPAAYTPICTTELAAVAKLAPEFAARGVKVVGFSCDSEEEVQGWLGDVEAFAGGAPFSFPVICDSDRSLAVRLGMLDPSDVGQAGLAMPVRAVFIVGPDKLLKLSILYPATTGRNFDEILRVLDSLQLTAVHGVATPANWKLGEDCYVTPKVKPEEFPMKFPDGVEVVSVPSGKEYLKKTSQPK